MLTCILNLHFNLDIISTSIQLKVQPPVLGPDGAPQLGFIDATHELHGLAALLQLIHDGPHQPWQVVGWWSVLTEKDSDIPKKMGEK